MIVDSVKSFEKYISLHKDFDKVYKFIRENDLAKLEPGKHSIVPENVWCEIKDVDLDPEQHKDEPYRLDVHDSFVDVNVIVSGGDVFGFKSRLDCAVEGWKYDEKSDTATIEEVPDVFMSVQQDNLVIFFPSDAHSVMLGQGHLREAVFKVRL